MRAPTACLLLVGTLLLPAGANATDAQPPEIEPPQIAGVRVGFAGRYKVGLWTPVEVTLHGGSRPVSGQLSLTVPDGDGVPSRVATPPDEPCQVLPGQDTRVLLYARFGRINAKLTVEFRHADGQVVRKKFTADETADPSGLLPAVGASRRMIVEVGVDPLGVKEAIALQRQAADRQTVVVRLDDASRLPEQSIGYEGVDTLVLSTSRPGIYQDLAPEGPRIEALDRWVRLGGKLIVCVGSQAGRFRGGDPLLAPLKPLLPGRLELDAQNAANVTIYPLRQTGALETYCTSRVPIPPRDADHVPQVPKLIGLHVDAIVEAQEADLPLVVRMPRGFGQIVFFAGDLDRPPLSQWADRPRLVSKLLGFSTADAEESAGRAGLMRFGFDDMAGQLRSALDQFSGVWLVPFWVVVALIAVYILLIGPGDYFFLRKVTRRMQWTWLTFPAIVLVFSVGAYLAAHWLKGNRVRINQIDLVDVDVGTASPAAGGTASPAAGGTGARSALVRGTSWINVFSPRTRTFNFSLQPKLPDGTVPDDAQVTLSWLGLPGEFLGGMNPRVSNPELWSEAYDFSPRLDAMQNVPIQIWSTKSLTARWSAHAEICPTAELVEEGRVLKGTITNTLPFPLSHCFLIHGRHAYTLKTRDNYDPDDPGKLGTLQPGESTVLGALTRQSELKTLLTGRKLRKLGDSHQLVSTPYRQSSVDLPYILQAMMFFEEAGGRRYTELGNGYQGFVDLTHLLKANRAILVARGPTVPGGEGHGAQLLCSGRDRRPITAKQERHVTVYRFVFPVETTTTP